MFEPLELFRSFAVAEDECDRELACNELAYNLRSSNVYDNT